MGIPLPLLDKPIQRSLTIVQAIKYQKVPRITNKYGVVSTSTKQYQQIPKGTIWAWESHSYHWENPSRNFPPKCNQPTSSLAFLGCHLPRLILTYSSVGTGSLLMFALVSVDTLLWKWWAHPMSARVAQALSWCKTNQGLFKVSNLTKVFSRSQDQVWHIQGPMTDFIFR